MTEQFLKVKTLTKTYKNGLKITEKVAVNIRAAMHRVFVLNKASLIIVDGGVGEGKTTLCEHCAGYSIQVYNELYNKTGIKQTYERNKQLAMGGEDFMNKMSKYSLEKPVIIYDESGDFTGKRSLSAFNFRLTRIFETYRSTKTLVILSLPTFIVLDNTLMFNKIPRMLFHCENRTLNSGKIKAFSLWRMFYIRHKAKKLVNPLQAYNYVESNFYGHFLNHDPKDCADLELFSTIGKANIHKEIYIQQSGMIEIKTIARELQVSTGYVRQLISKNKVKEDFKIGNKKYYIPEIVSQLKRKLPE